MRTFLFILIGVFSVAAQSPATVTSLKDAEQLARNGEFEPALKGLTITLQNAQLEQAGTGFISHVQYDIGACEFRLELTGQAIGHLEDAIRSTNGYYPKAFYALGMAHARLQNWPQARTAFLTTLKADKTNGEAWFDLGVAYLGENHMENAETAFRNAIKFGTRDASVGHNNVGVIRALNGEMSSAVREFETALKLSNGDLAEARQNLNFCRTLSERTALVAKLEFGKRTGETNE